MWMFYVICTVFVIMAINVIIKIACDDFEWYSNIENIQEKIMEISIMVFLLSLILPLFYAIYITLKQNGVQ